MTISGRDGIEVHFRLCLLYLFAGWAVVFNVLKRVPFVLPESLVASLFDFAVKVNLKHK